MKLGLCLAGGGVKGAAHIGVLKAFEDEKQIEYKSIAHQKDTLEKEKEKFEKYKDNEQKKLEQESKNLSQSCARFKELVTQFNSGFGQLPGKE